jgi:hypothetical protein
MANRLFFPQKQPMIAESAAADGGSNFHRSVKGLGFINSSSGGGGMNTNIVTYGLRHPTMPPDFHINRVNHFKVSAKVHNG